ncbi:TIGR04222 domain-containing membrane protein [Phytohabitans flavus]|uniref:TIGR04222 domain-containing membrane protein n=1 Tax=Phytohabitans flavus TaxID=1076124 RepID=UPI003636DDA3
MTWYAMGDTWGISSATFAVAYALLAAAAIGGAALHRYRALAGPTQFNAKTLASSEVAYLQGGPDLAVYSALAALRCADAVGVSTERQLLVTGEPARRATRLARAVYDAAGRSALPGSLRADAGVAKELARIGDRLERAGLLPDGQTRAALTTARYLLTAVLVLGVLRLLSGIANEKPLVFLLLTVLALAATIVVLWRWRPRRTRAGVRALEELRDDHEHLDPAENPSWRLYGPAAAGLAVGLYGSNALWVADPAFAAEAAVRKDLATAPATGSSSSCGSGSSGGSCGSDGGGGGGGGGCGGGGCGG